MGAAGAPVVTATGSSAIRRSSPRAVCRALPNPDSCRAVAAPAAASASWAAAGEVARLAARAPSRRGSVAQGSDSPEGWPGGDETRAAMGIEFAAGGGDATAVDAAAAVGAGEAAGDNPNRAPRALVRSSSLSPRGRRRPDVRSTALWSLKRVSEMA